MLPRGAHSGFSLIELLVALAVFSIAVVALLNLTGESTRTAASLEERAMAAVVAENRLLEVISGAVPLAEGEDRGEVEMAERQWGFIRVVSPTPEPEMVRVHVRVGLAERRETLAEVTAFRRRP